MMTNTQRNVSLAIAIAFFGGYALFELYRGHGRSAYEASFLGILICSAILRIAQSKKRPSNPPTDRLS
jgi:hypothetical protein